MLKVCARVDCGKSFDRKADQPRQTFCSRACANARERKPLDARFWAKVNKNGPVPAHRSELGPCWVWTARHDEHGYGRVRLRGRRTVSAHRVAWELVRGLVPADLCVLHACDNPSCVNPDHLFTGTKNDNTADMMAKSRHRGGFVSTASDASVTATAGSANVAAVIDEQTARAIRAATGSTASVARRMGLTYAIVWDVRNGRTWRHVT